MLPCTKKLSLLRHRLHAPVEHPDPQTSRTLAAAPSAPLRRGGRQPDFERSPTPPLRRRLGIGVLLLTAFCLGLGQTVLFAILPPIARDIGMSEMQVGLIFTVSAAFWVLTSPRWGRLSDRLGRRPVALIGVGAFVLAMLALTAAIGIAMSGALSVLGAFALMTAARCVHGAFGSAGPAASQAYIADRSSPAERTSAMSNYAAAYGLGAVAGPGIGAVGALVGALVPLILVAVVGAVAFVLIWRLLPEATPPAERRRSAVKLGALDERLRIVLLYGLLSGILNAVPLQVLGFYLLDTLDLAEDHALASVGTALMTMSAASLFAQLVLVRRLRPTPRGMMRTAPLLCAVGYVGVVLGGTLPLILAGLVFAGLGLGMSMPAFNAAASLSVTPEEQGGAAGLATAAGASGFIVAPVIAFTLYELTPHGPFLLGAGVALVMALLAWTSLNPALGARSVPAR
ncbi:MFS transporter [Parvularcula oceani]|uniref:MFS transporter n=1 Tax=Parvularcula oceani TaxID=1247963 RepID=UPI00307BB94A